MKTNLLLRSAAVAALCVCGLGHVQAQESPFDFMRHQWQRQQSARQAPQPQAPVYARGNWATPSYGQRGWGSYAEWSPPQDVERERDRDRGRDYERPRSMPQVHVDNPDFLTYAPDRLQARSLAKACDSKSGEQASAANAPAADADQAASAQPSDFAKACAATPAVSLNVLPQVADALNAYYAAHPQFVWVQDGTISQRAYAALKTLGAAGQYGLNPADYRVDVPPRPDDETARAQALLRFEFALSAKALTYVLDAQRGRVDPNRISGYHDLPRKSVDLLAAMKELASSDDVAATLVAQNPGNDQFRALTAELARLRADAPEASVAIAPNTMIRPGDDNPELPHVVANLKRALPADLREKYAAALDNAGTRYSRDLVEAVKAFQKEKGVSADGMIGKHTIAMLGGGKEDGKSAKIQKIELALERLRWLPRTFGDTYVFLNQPAFQVSLVQKGKEPLTMRAVVGKPSAQTYFFVDKIKDVEYNPYWNVPRSIVINEMLPRLYRDPSWLDHRGYEVANQRGRQVASNLVNWAAFARDKTSVDVRQPPGERNALGRLKIEFPNKHAIYMHDTNEKHLFKHDMRALSHGCVRLQFPREMAAALLGTDVGHIDKRIGSKQTDKEFVKRDIPVYLAYFTAWPDADGKVRFYSDVYDRDAHLKLALEKTEAAKAE